jgi:nucleoside-diphosphate-sugar epimerase
MRQRFYEVNVTGTRNLLAGLDGQRALERFVFVSTVAVYGVDRGELLDESAPRQAVDPYGKTKRLAEDLVVDWCEARRIRWGIVRLPLVVGRGAPGNFGAMVRALRGGWYVGIGDGLARRSMVTAEDAACGIWSVGNVGGVYHLTDGENPTLRELESRLGAALGRRWIPRMPVELARMLAAVGDLAATVSGREMPFDSRRYGRMTATLTFSDQKARREIGWNPRSVLAALGSARGIV